MAVLTLNNFQNSLGSYPNAGGTGTITVDNTIVKNGTQTIKLSPAAGANINVDIPIASTLPAGDMLAIFVYVNESNATNSLIIYVSNSNFAKFFTKTVNGGSLKAGWNHVVVAKSEFSTGNGAVWTAVDKFRLRATAGAGRTFFVCIDSIYWHANERPKFCLQFDDGYAGVYNSVFQYAKYKNVVGTIYACSGLQPPNYMTPAQYQEMYADGWDIGNHTNLHEDLSTLTLEAAKTTINTCNTWLLNNGLDRAANHLAYPVNLPNTTAIQAASDCGMLTARTVFNASYYPTERRDRLEVNGYGVGRDTLLATVTAEIDVLLSKGGTIMLYIHNVLDTPVTATTVSTANVHAIIDYIATKRDSGLLDILTITEWYRYAKAKWGYPMGSSPIQYQGPPRNNITLLTGDALTIDPAGTYELVDTNGWREVTGWTAGTASDFFDADGIPIPFTGQQLIDVGTGPRLYCGLRKIAGYTVDQDAPTNAKIIKILKVPTYIDTLYWADSAEMDWSASNE